jgi:hypothetical protein
MAKVASAAALAARISDRLVMRCLDGTEEALNRRAAKSGA